MKPKDFNLVESSSKKQLKQLCLSLEHLSLRVFHLRKLIRHAIAHVWGIVWGVLAHVRILVMVHVKEDVTQLAIIHLRNINCLNDF